METLLLCPFKYFFLRFVLTCATVKSIMFYRFAYHHVQLFVTFFYNEIGSNHSFLKYQKKTGMQFVYHLMDVHGFINNGKVQYVDR